MAEGNRAAVETRRRRLSEGGEGPGKPTEVSGRFATLKRSFREFRGGQHDRLGRGADVLRRPGAVPGTDRLRGDHRLLRGPRHGHPDDHRHRHWDRAAVRGGYLRRPIRSVTSSSSTSGILAIVGIVVALWSASGYVGAFMRASNIVYETPEGRPFWKLRPLQMLVTLIMLILAVVVVLALILTGPIVEAVAAPLGIGDTAVTVWQIAKWPVLVAIVITMIAVLYYAAPNVKHPGFKWASPGSIFAVLVWILASVAFAFYVANFGSYNETYGSLGGVIVFLMWLWITNNAILLGAQLNSELERSRELEAGVPGAEREIQAEPRDEPKEPKTAGMQPRDEEASSTARR